jgi:RNA polymerase sigma-70 factor (ECF subfamily)
VTVNLADLTDQDLFHLARQSGSQAKRAYAELVTRHQASAVRLATYLLAGSADAEDVAQDAFVRALVHVGNAADGTTFGPWLRTIVTRLCFNHRRNVRTRGESAEDEGWNAPAPRVPSSARSAVEWTLSQLPYPYREILVLRFVEEMSVLEIGQVLGLGESAAKMRLARARERFQEIFEGEHKGSGATGDASTLLARPE